MTNWAENIGFALISTFKTPAHEGPLTRMFRVEYGKEYHNMKKLGYEINDSFVKEYLR